MATSAVNAFLPHFAFEELDLPAQRAGRIVALLGLLGAVSRVTVGVLGDSAPRMWRWLCGLAFAGAASTSLLFPALDRPGLVWAGDRDGRSTGVVIGGFLLGMVAGPLAFGRLTDHLGYAARWWLVIAALVVAGSLAAAAAVVPRFRGASAR